MTTPVHSWTVLLGAAFVLLLGLAGWARAQDEGFTATICINLQDKKAPVSPTLYGIFMEEISHAFDGGIYAELIQNRSFEEGILPPGLKLVKKEDGTLKMELMKLPEGVPAAKWDMPWPWFMNCGWNPNRDLLGWSLRNEGGAQGEMKITEANPMNAASARSLELSVTLSQDAGGRVALVNGGYWGINVQAGAPYELKFFLRPGAYEGEVTALLESKDGRPLARHDFGAVKPGESWQRFVAALQATGADPAGRLALCFRGKGTLQVDWVSLFPPTYKGRPNGLRIDLAKYLEEPKPSFVRYPGGCYVEGLSFESAPDWRKMVCPPEERPGMWGYWQYRSTDGFGYHEFLQFCEDIGADAMYVTFAGMTVHPENNWPLGDLDAVIQRTLDAIEYAVGPADSRWGAVRAKRGHPKPFPLKYVEIGNEHPPALYGDYWDTPGVGQWQVKDGVLQQTDKGRGPAMLLLKSPRFKAGRVTLKARRVEGSEGFLMFFNAAGPERFLFCNYGAAGNKFSAIQDRGVPEGCSFRGGMSTQGGIEMGRWYEISLVLGRDKAEMFLDGKKVSDAKAEYLPAFFAAAGYDVKGKTVVLKATNYHAKPVRAEIQLDGAVKVEASGRHIMIRSDDPYAENSLDNPRRIVPQEQPFSGCGARFSVTLAPYSVNVLRIPASDK
jgi:alpha-L-arabinofuranosidase